MYIRNLRKPSPSKNIYKFASRKNRSTIMCESGLEFDACFHLEFSPSIAAFESQPKGIEYLVDGKVRRYTPDFKIVKTTGEIEYIEVKPERTQHIVILFHSIRSISLEHVFSYLFV